MNKQREGSNHLKTHNTVAIRLNGLINPKNENIYTYIHIIQYYTRKKINNDSLYLPCIRYVSITKRKEWKYYKYINK